MSIEVGKPAIWISYGYDIPVMVLAEGDVIDGVKYYLVEGTSEHLNGMTGVPEDQLIQEKPTEEKSYLQELYDIMVNLFNLPPMDLK